jgi:hypothetical protein
MLQSHCDTIATASNPIMKSAPFLVILLASPALAATWYVTPAGNDANAGTGTAPVKTIQHAASLAKSGDSVWIYPGVYRETVKPGADNITFIGKFATISGAGDTPVDLGAGKNQVFANGAAIPEASFTSKITSVKLSQKAAPAGTPVTATISDPALTQPAGFWVGATLTMAPGQEWVWESGVVKANTPGSVTVAYQGMGLSYNDPVAGNPYFLTGSQIKPTPGTCTIDGAKVTLGQLPAGAKVEYKTRPWGFDLTGRHGIKISGLNFFACSIKDGYNDGPNSIDKCSFQYVGQDWIKPNGWKNLTTTGLQLFGSGDAIANSQIQFSSGNGLVLGGKNSTATNLTISDCDSAGGDEAGIITGGSGHTISHCTIHDCGRDGIKQSGTTGVLIEYCLIHDVMTKTTDGGAIYCYGGLVLNAKWSHNVVYHVRTGGYGGDAYYPDDNSNGVTIDHCLAVDCDHAFKANSQPVKVVYDHCSDFQCGDSVTGSMPGKWAGLTVTNCILTAPIPSHVGGNFAGSIFTKTPGYRDPAAGDFTLLPTSPAWKSGAGAFAPGQPAWSYGEQATKPTPEEIAPAGQP